MKKNKIAIYCLSALALFGAVTSITSCNNNNNDPVTPTPDDDKKDDDFDPDKPLDPTPDQDTDYHYDKWTSAQQELLKKYCGEVLPFPSDAFSSNVIVEEIHDEEYDYYYLEIADSASSFTLKDYYKTLEKVGWNVITPYNENKVQTDGTGSEFVELTKVSTTEDVGYDMLYSFNSGYNVIHCYNDLTSTSSSDTSWNVDDKYTIKESIATELPFINLGSTNRVYQSDRDALQIIDTYAVDLSKTYAELLIKDGYELSTSYSTQYNSWILVKELDDGSQVLAQIYYMNGNGFSFTYLPKVKDYDAWPSEVCDEIKKLSGVEIPAFASGNNAVFSTYKKNDTYYIYTESLDENFDYEEYGYNQLKYFKLTWNETLTVNDFNLVDEDYEVIGYGIEVTINEPISTFVESWPSNKISSTLEKLLGITDVNIPAIDSSLVSSEYKMKYYINDLDAYNSWYAYYYTDIKDFPSWYGLSEDASEEEIDALAKNLASREMGIVISLIDNDFAINNAYEETLEKSGWYKGYNDYGNTYFEDPEGKVRITLQPQYYPAHDDEGYLDVVISGGSGETHTQEFAFEYDEYSFAIGTNENSLGLIKSMLPYDVTFTSSDETGGISVNEFGEVSISEDVEDGATATITATMNVPGEDEPRVITCTVTAVKVLVYTPYSSIEAVNALLEEKGYHGTVINDNDTNKITLELDSSTDVETVKSLVDSSFIPEGFEIMGEWTESTLYPDSDTEVEGYMVDYSIWNDYCYVVIEFQVYQIDGVPYLTIFAF